MFTYPFTRNLNITSLRRRPLKDFLSTLACVAGGIRERASGGGAAYYLVGLAREAFHERRTLHQSSHGFATRVHGFASKTKARAREIPPAT